MFHSSRPPSSRPTCTSPLRAAAEKRCSGHVTGMMSLFLVLWILSQDEEVIIATTRFFRDPYMAGVPKSTPVEQKDARPGSMVDQIVGRSDTTMRNTDVTTSIDIDILHRIAQQLFHSRLIGRRHHNDYTIHTQPAE